jgi:2-oxoglutarate ferredoxin oxidoreductase subunit delta
MPARKAKEINVNAAWCKHCGICIAFCAPEVLKPDAVGVPLVADLEACTLCMLCELRCPDFAIEVVEDKKKEDAPRHASAAAHAG